MKYAYINTPISPMIAVAKHQALYSLEFADSLGPIPGMVLGETEATQCIKKELELYFAGKLREFQTPLVLERTDFQRRVWEELRKIPFGQKISYLELAMRIGNPKSSRAVANANGANRFSIVIPCHRVIYANGKLGGYSSGIERKKWLLEHELLKF